MAKRNSIGFPVEAATPVSAAEVSSSTATSEIANLYIHSSDIETAQTFSKSCKGKQNVLFEIFAQVLQNKGGKVRGQRVILLRNGRIGPVLQSFYYETTHPLPPIEIGDLVRCIGRFIGDSPQFRIEKLTIIDDPEHHLALIDRLWAISNYTMKK